MFMIFNFKISNINSKLHLNHNQQISLKNLFFKLIPIKLNKTPITQVFMRHKGNL